MAKTVSKHVHKLRRHVHKSGNAVLFCALPDCSFKINPALALGKRSICWRCGEEFIMNEYSLRLTKPHCEKCHKPKKNKNEVISIPEPFILGPGLAKKPEFDTSLAERLRRAINAPKTSESQVPVEIEDEEL